MSVDIFDDIFTTLSLKGALYFRTDFSPPWSVTVPSLGKAARFHLVMEGRCFIRVEGGDFVELTAGDLILIPHGVSHVIAHEPCAMAPPLETVLDDAGYQGDGVLIYGSKTPFASTQLVCGHFTFREGAEHPLLEALPDYLLTRATTRMTLPLLDEVLNLIKKRIFEDSLGSFASITRLSEIVFIELLRSGFSQEPRLRILLEGFRDPKISYALSLIHSQPEEYWTVQKLALHVAMSRSRFAKRFQELIGKGPMAYLSDWRLQKAYSLLEGSHLSVQQIASRTGYQSAAAFTRAFSNKFGLVPTECRRIAT